MILGTAESINGVSIRLTDERWEHILDSRPYLRNYEEDVLDTIETPDLVLRAAGGVQVAVTSHGRNGFLHVVYREVNRGDGFVITAYLKDSYNRRQVIWRANE
ncbi:MAG: hypothetical protein HOP19_29580 [Acidobacteria bacterium]|nr:hypothetical protein [Acidobacteriota bacterium]